MKLKAVLNVSADAGMVNAVHFSAFRKRIVGEVLVPHLHMKEDIGPAEFYIQESDRVVGDERQLCEVRLTGVSANKNRATNDFYRARHALERIYAQTLHPLLRPGEKLQLMVSLMVDQPPLGENSTLIERKGGNPAIWIVQGQALPFSTIDEE